jgi:hypothetical protein
MAGKITSSKIVAGSLALLALSGCRFGNYSEPQPDPNASDGGFESVELFQTHPTQLSVAVVYNDTSQVSTQDQVPLAAIPAEALAKFTDPLYFVVNSDADHTPYFIGKTGEFKVMEQTGFDDHGNLRIDYAMDGGHTLWKNPACLTQVQISHDGQLDRDHPGSATLGDNIYNTAGRVILDRMSLQVIDGDCAADLQDMAQCYQESTQCENTEAWEKAVAFFDLYVRQTGILKIEDVARIKGLAYIVRFE